MEDTAHATTAVPAPLPGSTATPNGHRHLTLEEIKQGCITVPGATSDDVRICRVDEELKQGLTEMEEYAKSVTFYGSARFSEGDEFYDRARHLAYRIAKELGYTVVTGGGPGIMEAGNRGAYEAGGKSVGLSIKLPMEQKDNPYITDEVPFYFFFARKVSLSYSSEVFVFFPGGFGTFDECFEVITLLQTKKIKPVPVVLYGTAFWQPFVDLIKQIMLEKYKTISAEDLNIFKVTDNDDEVLEIVKNAKLRTHELNELD